MLQKYRILIFFNVLIFTNILSLQKVTYDFKKDPIDIVIPCHEKDIRTLNLVLKGVKKYIKYHRLIVISERKFTENAEWFDQAKYPFSKKIIAQEIFQDTIEALKFLYHPKTRINWIYQQLLKLYAPLVIPNISSNILVLDADAIFVKKVTFQDQQGAPLFNTAVEYYPEYFRFMQRLIPGLKRVHENTSGVTHHMLFQKCVIEDLFSIIKEIHHKEPWKAICHCLDHDYLLESPLSEYELYLNFILTRTNQAKLRKLKFDNVALRDFNKTKKTGSFDYIACHTYIE